MKKNEEEKSNGTRSKIRYRRYVEVLG